LKQLEADSGAFLEAARKLGLEGIVSKKATALNRITAIERKPRKPHHCRTCLKWRSPLW
jgi:hypothetical protein